MNEKNERKLKILKESPWFIPGKTKTNGRTVYPLVCSVCGVPNSFGYQDELNAIICNEKNSCGAIVPFKDLFPDFYKKVEQEFPATKKNPNLPAIEYLRSRGIPDEIIAGSGARYLKNIRGCGSGGVSFPIGLDENGKEILAARIFDPPSGQGKNHFTGTTAVKFYKNLTYLYRPDKPIWLVEGVIDSLSLLAFGIQSIAVLSAGQDPSKLDLSEFKKLVLAFDGDAAGYRACRKWKAHFPDAEVMLPDPGQDWNDILLSAGIVEAAKKIFDENQDRYRFNGRLVLAGSPQEYADLWFDFYSRPPGMFTFNGATYFAERRQPRGTNQPAFTAANRCLKGVVDVASFLIDRNNPAQPQYVYCLKINPTKGRPFEAIATGADLANPRRLKEWFLSFAKLTWEGDVKAATAFSLLVTSSKAPEVQQLTVAGYQPETGDYIFSRWGVDGQGNLLTPDKRDHFKTGNNRYFKSPAHASDKYIHPTGISKERIREIFQHIYKAWGFNGVTAFSWVIAGWFVNQIKDAIDFYAFLSCFGDPASGKSGLVTTLNAIQGRNLQGLSLTQLNSKKGLTRTIGQISGQFTALLEDSNRNEKGFDYSILLTAYNKGSLQVQAAFSNDLQTKESPFLGTLLFCQNLEPFNSKQEKQRVISLHFTTDLLTDESCTAYNQLATMKRGDLAGIMRQVLINRKHFEDGWQQEYQAAIIDLGEMSERRILQNHALVFAFYRLFCRCFDIRIETGMQAFIADLGRKKCVSSAIRQTTLADHFFELLDTVEESKLVNTVHFDSDKGLIYLNLPRAEKLIRNRGINLQVTESLSQALQRHPAYLRNSVIYRFPNDPEKDSAGRPRQRRVWQFDLAWFLKNETESM